MKTQIRTNDMRTFKSCRRQWFFTSHQRLNLERKRPVSYFFLGRGVHYALDALYGTGEPPTEAFQHWYHSELNLVRAQTGGLFEEEEQMFHELLTLGTGMLEHYLKWATASANTGINSMETVPGPIEGSCETEFTLPLIAPSGRASPRYLFAGRFDRIVRYQGALWVVEYKTAAPQAFGNVSQRLNNDEQATSYIYALSRLYPNERVGGALFIFLKKKLPTVPTLVYKGTDRESLSQNKSMDTTLEVYANEVRRRGFNVEVHMNFLRYLQEKGNTFFVLHEVKRHPRQLQQFERDLYRVARDMARTLTLGDAYPNPPWYGCQRCNVRDLCDLVSIGADPDFLMYQEYRPRRAWREDIQKEEETI